MSRATITSDQFFLALIAVLTKRGMEYIILTPDIDVKFEAAFSALLRLRDEIGIQPDFSFRTNKLHGVSSVLRDAIDSASRNNIVSLENPSFRRMKPKLTTNAIDFHLSRLPIAEEDINKIVDECLTDFLPENHEQNTA